MRRLSYIGGFSHFSGPLKDKRQSFGIILGIQWCLHLQFKSKIGKVSSLMTLGTSVAALFWIEQGQRVLQKRCGQALSLQSASLSGKMAFLPSKSVVFIRFCVTKPGLVARCWPPAACV